MKWIKNVLLICLGLILFSCAKDPVECEECKELDLVYDLAGFLDPNKTVDGWYAELFVRPEFKDEMLALLGAVESDPGYYDMMVQTTDGSYVDQVITVVEVEIPFYFTSDVDPEDPTIIKSKYKAYVNAKCKEIYPENTVIPCDTLVSEGEEDRYFSVDGPNHGKCVKGEEVCLEIEQIVAFRTWYEDGDCTIATEIVTQKDFSCD